MNAIRRYLRTTSLLVVFLVLTSVQSAAAHAGHSHADDNGIGVDTMLSVAGVIVALGIAWRMTSRFSHVEVPGGDKDPASD